jgi:DNA-binding protein HU-beta
MRQRPKPRSSSVSRPRPALAHEVPPGDARVGRAVGDELGDVLGAHEDRLELAAERRGEGAVAAHAHLEPGVGEEVAGVLGEAALVGESDPEHRWDGSGAARAGAETTTARQRRAAAAFGRGGDASLPSSPARAERTAAPKAVVVMARVMVAGDDRHGAQANAPRDRRKGTIVCRASPRERVPAAPLRGAGPAARLPAAARPARAARAKRQSPSGVVRVRSPPLRGPPLLPRAAPMNKSDLIAAVADEHELSRAKATAIVNQLFDPTGGVIAKALKKGDIVTITGFGSFEQRKRGARTFRNPQTGSR